MTRIRYLVVRWLSVSFVAGAVVDSDWRCEREQVVFVAPHNAQVERQSTRFAEPSYPLEPPAGAVVSHES